MAVADLARIRALLERGARWVLTTHVNPDGDGIGSELALAALARVHGVEPRIINRDPVPRRLAFLDPGATIETYDATRHRALIENADVVVMLDNSDPSRLEEMMPAVRASRATKVCIDHHPDPDPFWEVLYVRQSACCTGEIIWDLFESCGVPLDPVIAEALYTTLVSDTGRFRFANTTARSFEMADALVRAGVVATETTARLEERVRVEYCRLLGHALSTLELHADGRLAVVRVPERLATQTAADGEDLARIINEALGVEGVSIAVLLRERSPVETKVSLRSIGRLDVNGLARAHGGGGHRNASGIVLPVGIDRALDVLMPDLVQLLAAQ